MEKTYYLDLKTLLEYLRGKSAILRITTMLPKQRQPCQGYIFLKKGSILHSYVLSQTGTLMLEGTSALTQLNAGTEWHVQIGDERTIEGELVTLLQKLDLDNNMPLAKARAAHSVQIPRQMRALDAVTLQQFSPEQILLLRTVFAVVNGERTVEQIKAQLRLPPGVVEEVLSILLSLNVIG